MEHNFLETWNSKKRTDPGYCICQETNKENNPIGDVTGPCWVLYWGVWNSSSPVSTLFGSSFLVPVDSGGKFQRNAIRKVRESLMDVSENSGCFPPNHPWINRVFHYFHHLFWGTPIFGNTLMDIYGYFIWNAFDVNPSTLVGISNKDTNPAENANKKVQILALYLSDNPHEFQPTKKNQLSLQKRWFKKSKWQKKTLTSSPALASSWWFPWVFRWPTSRYRGRGQGCPNLGSKLVHRDRAHPGGSGRWNHPPVWKPLEKPMGFLWGGFWVSCKHEKKTSI